MAAGKGFQVAMGLVAGVNAPGLGLGSGPCVKQQTMRAR